MLWHIAFVFRIVRATQTGSLLVIVIMKSGCTVVTMVREPLDTTLNFVAWYLELGAAKIVICFDDPDDPALPILQDMNLERVETFACTPEFWRSLGISPKHVMRKQKAVFNWVYRQAQTSWVLVVDGDEYLYLNGRTLDEFAATLSEDVPAVRFRSAEPVETTADGQWFRVQVKGQPLSDIYGEYNKFFANRSGLLGHPEGKSMTRTGIAARMRLHWAENAQGQPINGISVGAADGACLLHYFNNGYDEWRCKLDWRKSTWGFARAVSEHLDEYDEAQLKDLYDKLHSINQAQLEALKAIGGIHRLDVDLEAARKRVLGR